MISMLTIKAGKYANLQALLDEIQLSISELARELN